MTWFKRLRNKIELLLLHKRGSWRIAALGLVAFLGFAAPAAVHAGQCGLDSISSCIAMVFVWIFQILTALMGYILIMEVDALIRVAQYFNFVTPGPTAVRIGWIVTRDLANMFFIVFLLIIAFSTVIGYSKYHYEKNLSRLLIMAVVINFSKTICGLLIDASQVLMLSFVNGFKAAAAGNFLNAFQISNLLRLADGADGYDFGLVLAMMLAFVLAAIATCVVLVMLVMLVFRVVMLWVLIIMSPIAFLTSAFPLGGNYYAQWWGELKKYLVGGPVVAFFLWLALATAQQTGGKLSSATEGWGSQTAAATAEVEGSANKSRIPSEAGRTDTILSMVIATCILFAGLKFASDPSIGGMAAGFAGKVNSKAKAALKGATMYGIKRTAEPVMTNVGKGLARIPLVGGAGRYMALTGEKWKKDRIASREKMFGGAEDLARLSPGAFNRELNSLASKTNLDGIDKKRLDTMMGLGLKDPKLAQSLGDGTGAFALNSLIRGSSGKSLQDAVGLVMNDKNASGWAKKDEGFLRSVYDKVAKEAETDPNMKKTLGELEQKFAPQLAKMDLLDKNGKKVTESVPFLDRDGKQVIGDDGKPAFEDRVKKIVDKDKLKNLVPKMSADDIGGIESADDMALFMPYMNNSQFRKVLQDGKPKQVDALGKALGGMKPEDISKFLTDKGVNASDLASGSVLSLLDNQAVAMWALKKSGSDPRARSELMGDPERAKKLTAAAAADLATARQGKDEDKIAAAAVQAMTVGALKVDDLKNDTKLQGILGRNMDTTSLARGIDKDDAGQLAVAREAFKALMKEDPARVRNLSKNDLYAKLIPTKAEIDSSVAENQGSKRKEFSDQAPALHAEISAQLAALASEIASDQAAGRPTNTKEEQTQQLTRALSTLEQATQRRATAEQELAQMTTRLAEAQNRGADAATIAGLQGSLDRLTKGVQEMESDLAKQVAALKGQKFDDGTGNRRNRGGGGGGGGRP